jgi:hypothetical protein
MINRGNSRATASVTGMVSETNGVAMTPIPPPNPALEIPKMIMARTAHNQKAGG